MRDKIETASKAREAITTVEMSLMRLFNVSHGQACKIATDISGTAEPRCACKIFAFFVQLANKTDAITANHQLYSHLIGHYTNILKTQPYWLLVIYNQADTQNQSLQKLLDIHIAATPLDQYLFLWPQVNEHKKAAHLQKTVSQTFSKRIQSLLDNQNFERFFNLARLYEHNEIVSGILLYELTHFLTRTPGFEIPEQLQKALYRSALTKRVQMYDRVIKKPIKTRMENNIKQPA